MELEKQVCSLELAKKLKELGVKQESLFYYLNPYFRKCSNDEYVIVYGQDSNLEYSAFTVAELGFELKDKYISGQVPSELPRFHNGMWIVVKGIITHRQYINVSGTKYKEDYFPIEEYFDTEANARARQLIILIENKLMEV